jgi:predicted TIM-barrel fold metal-dependent hydrolase
MNSQDREHDGPIPIIDAHHHLWDLGAHNYPWLEADPLLRFRYGDYSKLRSQSFLWSDYLRETAGYEVVQTVAIEAEWNRADPLGETRWMQGVADEEGLPSAFVAHARLDLPDAETVIAGQAQFALVRGIRHKPRAASSPEAVEVGVAGSMSDANWRRGFGLLAAYGLHFELQAPWWHLPEAVSLAEAYPDVPIVLNHAGLPADRSAEGLSGWRSAMCQFAALPHASVKISGLGGLRGRWESEENYRIVRDVIEIFGVDRAMFGSNYPVDSLCVGFDAMYECYRSAVADLSRGDRQKLFHNNAARIYRLN